VAVASAAAQADICAQPVNEPFLAATRVDASQPHDIAKAKRND
jgi:hypothetical protein